METVALLLTFLGTHIWALIVILALFLFRKSLSGLLDRLLKLNFKWGEASGGMETTPPLPPAQTQQLPAPESPPAPEVPQESADASSKLENQENWFIEMHAAFHAGDIARAKTLYESHHRKEPDPEIRYWQHALYLFLLFTRGKDSDALRELETFHRTAINDDQRSDSASYLSTAYETSRNLEKAAQTLEHALARISDPASETRLTTQLARLYHRQGQTTKAIAFLERRIAEASNISTIGTLYATVASLSKEAGDHDAAGLAYEKALEYASSPDRTQMFEAAYSQGESHLRLLSVLHYDTALELDSSDSSSLNNLAVAAHEFGFPGKEVALLQRAGELGNSLALANLANAYMRAGFWTEAKTVLDKARFLPEPHQNVGNSLFKLHTAQDEEKTKWKDLLRKAEALQPKVRALAEAYFDAKGSERSFSGKWMLGDIEIVVREENAEVATEWTEAKSGALAIGMSTIKCSLKGKRRNRSADLTYRRESAGNVRSILFGPSETITHCRSYLSVDGRSWHVFSTQPGDLVDLMFRRVTS